MRTDLTAVIPALDCVDTIGPVVAATLAHVGHVIVVDDGSTDGTGDAARAAGATVVSLPANRGKGFALRRGLELALEGQPAAIVLLDGDGQHDPAEIPALVRAWERSGSHLVVGTRWANPRAIPWSRYWTNYVGSRVLSWMAGTELLDSQSGFRLLDATVVRRLGLVAHGFAIESEMLLKAARRGICISHVPVRAIYSGSRSHFRPVLDTVRISCAAVYFKVFDDA